MKNCIACEKRPIAFMSLLLCRECYADYMKPVEEEKR